MNKEIKTSCPICGKKNTWQKGNQYKPFCSGRCKLIDLGEWANELRKLPGSQSSIAMNDEEDDHRDEL
ncbi:DNA gyrase inhibitor YacG [Legionella waltersii]|nr:DNA gyrase inhibitor YacG [Legionella waltersii]